jgi:hypothetical protein
MRTRQLSLLLGGALATLVLAPATPAVGASNVHSMKVYVGYADGLRGDPTIPSPWDGDRGVLFVGGGTVFDAGAIRIVNPSAQPLTIGGVSVDIGSVHYDVWGPYPIVVPGKGSAILTQTVEFDFDTSEAGGEPFCEPTGVVPVIHILVGSRHPKDRTFLDKGQVLNTGGIDSGACEVTNEGHPWTRIHGHD